MPRKIRANKQPADRKMSRNEKILYVVSAIVVLSMMCGTLAASLGR